MATKKPQAAPFLLSMTKPGLAKISRELSDLQEAVDDASSALTKGYAKIKKQGGNLEAWKLAEKLNRLNNPAKQQAFLLDFDRLRQLYGWDDQKNLFAEDKTAVQIKQEAAPKNGSGNGHAAPAGKAAKAAKEKASELAAKANAGVNRRTERQAGKAKKTPGRRPALFDEDSGGADKPLN